MIAVQILPEHITRAWIDLRPMLERAQAADQPDAMTLLREGRAQLWAVIDDDARPIGAVVTQLKPDGRCLLWQGAGRDVRTWIDLFVAAVSAWAREQGCTALYGCGRKGWARLIEPMGFRRVPDIDGRAAWELQIAGRR